MNNEEGRLAFRENTDKWRWVTLFLQILVGSVTSYVYLVTIYIGPLAETNGWNPEVIILEFTFMTAMGVVASIIGGRWKDKYGSQWCLKVGGIGFAVAVIISSISANVWFFVIGQGICATFFMYVVYIAAIANIGELFPDRRGFAIGFAIGAISLVSAVLSPITEWLIRTCGTSMSIVISGIVYGGIVFISGYFVINAPENYKPKGWEPEEYEKLDKSSNNDNNDRANIPTFNTPWEKIIKTPSFWIVAATLGTFNIMVMAFASNLSLIAQECTGVSTSKAAWMYTVYCITNAAGGFIVGSLSDKFGPMRTLMATGIITAAASVILAFFGMNNFTIFFAIVCIWMGVVGGTSLALIPTILMNAFGEKTFGVNYGILGIFMTIAGLIGPRMSMELAPETFFLVGGACTLAAVFISILAISSVNKYHGYKVLK